LIGLWRVRNESINGILATALIYVKAGCSYSVLGDSQAAVNGGTDGETGFGNLFSRLELEFDFDQSHCLKKRLNSP
jgi:hypothetical protein